MSGLCVEQKDYKDLVFLLEETKRILSDGSLSRTEISNLITEDSPQKHGVVYALLGKILNKDDFKNNGGKYSLKM